MADVQYCVMRIFVPGSPMADIYPDGMTLETYDAGEREYALADVLYYESRRGDQEQRHIVMRREVTFTATPWVEDVPEYGTFED